MKDEEGWREILPWVLSLTSRGSGQICVHHTGHDESRSYGTKNDGGVPEPDFGNGN